MINMIDYWNRILTNIKIAESGTCPNISSTNSDRPPGFPALLVDQIDNPDTAEDLENSENAVESTIEIQAYSNKSMTESRKIINIACDAMRHMGYRRRMGPKQVANAENSKIFRMVARFSRIIGTGEEIPKFESNP